MSVAIIGAGIAGLSAAYHLKNLDPAGNIAIQIFEARAEIYPVDPGIFEARPQIYPVDL